MSALQHDSISLLTDIADYSSDGRLTEPSDGIRYEWRKMIELCRKLGRPLTDAEAKLFQVG